MVTGGFRTREGIEDALSNGSCDIVGIGRPAALEAALPSKKLLGDGPADGETKLLKQKFEQPWLVNALGMKTIGAGAESVRCTTVNLSSDVEC
jgi:2,4-dienoyl-CoA reductase-like NADH-dependent reductase (Old Yellow Enzyme family)